MKRCDALADIGRRAFLRGAGTVVAGTSVAGLASADTKGTPAAARVVYPSNRLANLRDLKLNEPLDAPYPDADALGVLLKLGKSVPGGVGPERDIVGFSMICPHMGFPLGYNKSDRTLSCPGHYSRFDCEAGGQQIWGHATQNLAQYILRIDDKGDLYAEGIDELLYGRLSNVL